MWYHYKVELLYTEQYLNLLCQGHLGRLIVFYRHFYCASGFQPTADVSDVLNVRFLAF